MSNILSITGTHADNTLVQLIDVATRAKYVALMADGHLGYIMPVGGVAAYDNMISVAGVGFDIACGNAAIRTNLRVTDLGGRISDIADTIQADISFGIGRSNNSKDAPTDHPLFESDAWNAIPSRFRDALRAKARDQLGTIGSGNHYIDVFVDENGFVWVGVHFGSRGLGHTIATGVMALADGREWNDKKPETETLLSLDSPLGDAYWTLMNLAGEYAYAGREWAARKVVKMLGGTELELVHNHHNFAWKETHFDQDLIVVRKGATPAFPGQRGFVGGSMGDNAVILQGTSVPVDTAPLTLYSTVHGAGRVMSRTEAAGKIHRKTGRVIKEGKVSPLEMSEWLDRKGVTLRGGGLDESPHAYRRLPDVLSDQGDTIEILHTLEPIIVVMAGSDTYDPYKD